MDIDTVHQGAADFGAVADDHLRRAAAFLLGITILAVISVQPILRYEPNKALAVLKYTKNGVV